VILFLGSKHIIFINAFLLLFNSKEPVPEKKAKSNIPAGPINLPTAALLLPNDSPA
jgi:hypothetical protein